MLKDSLLPQGNLSNNFFANEPSIGFGVEVAPFVFLLDWSISDPQREVVCHRLRELENKKNFYLIVTTPKENSAEISEVLRAGADDCLFTPYSPEEFTARLMIAQKTLQTRAPQFSNPKAVVSVSSTRGQLNLDSLEKQELLNLNHDPIIIFNSLTNSILFTNDKACETYLIDRRDFVGMSLQNILLDNNHEFEMFGKLFDKGHIRDFETTHLRSDGFQINMIINSSLIEYGGQPAILTINKNVTQYRDAEAGIRIANVEWRNTVDAVSDMIILEDADGKIKRCNLAASRFFDQPYKKIVGQLIKNYFPIEKKEYDHSEIGNITEIFLKEKKWLRQFETAGLWFEVNSHHVKPELQAGNQWVHVIKDITKRKQFEDELQRLYTVIEQASSGIVITDLEGQIQYVNSHFVETVQESKTNLIEKSILEVPLYLTEQEFSDNILPALLKNNNWQQTFSVKRNNLEVFEEISVSLVKDAIGNPLNFVFMIRDVTETRQLESIAEAVNMMENVGYIFSGIRHELGNPINSVKTALTVMQKNLEKWSVDQIGLYIERCLSELARIEYLLRTLKTFSMYENPRIEAIEINRYMENFVNLIKEDFANRGIQIFFSTKVKNSSALCDPRVLHQIILNLLANAAAALEERDNPKIVIMITQTKKRLSFTIEDNGIGMNERQMDNLFKPFYTSKPDGTGLGLVIVRKMLAKMNGTINFESKEGIGTQVHFTLETGDSKL